MVLGLVLSQVGIVRLAQILHIGASSLLVSALFLWLLAARRESPAGTVWHNARHELDSPSCPRPSTPTPPPRPAVRGLGVSRADFLSLTKFRLSALVIVTTFFGFWLNSRDGINLALLLHTLLGARWPPSARPSSTSSWRSSPTPA